jgi:riboflavin kinase
LKPTDQFTLFKLAELGAHEKNVILTTGELANMTDVSQQTASRRLMRLEKQGLIMREMNGREQSIRLTKTGVESLIEMHGTLSQIFNKSSKEISFEATVFSGLGEGSYYVGLEGYVKQFKSKLGFVPFPGTLNLRIKPSDVALRKQLENFPSVWIEGFANEQRTYGAARCYHATVNGKVSGAIIVPVRAHYGEDVLEVIAPTSLRKHFKLKDGDKVEITVLSEPVKNSSS